MTEQLLRRRMVHEATGQHLTWMEAKIDSFFSFGVTRLTFTDFKDALETRVLKPGLS